MSRLKSCLAIGLLFLASGSQAGSQELPSIDFIDMSFEQMPNSLTSDLDESSALIVEDGLEDFVLIPVQKMPMASQAGE